jgi:hypothetical protein
MQVPRDRFAQSWPCNISEQAVLDRMAQRKKPTSLPARRLFQKNAGSDLPAREGNPSRACADTGRSIYIEKLNGAHSCLVKSAGRI